MTLFNRMAVNRLLPTRVPFRLRVFFRGTFLLLALATLALAVAVLQDEKERSYRNYQDSFNKNQAQIVAKLRHPTGQLVLLNPDAYTRNVTPLRPLVLPFSAIDFDDKYKAQQAIDMAGCLVQYPDAAAMCVAIGNNPFAGGFIYAVGSFNAGVLVPHTSGELDLSLAHRARITVDMRGVQTSWTAPFEAAADAARLSDTPTGPTSQEVKGRLVGFAGAGLITAASRPVRDFRGWLWQDGRCAEGAAPTQPSQTCSKRTFVSVRLPINLFRDAIWQKAPSTIVWPPADLDRIQVRFEMLAPGQEAPLFDSNAPGATAPFSWGELTPLLLPGEKLRVRKLGSAANNPTMHAADTINLAGLESTEPASPLMGRLIRALQVEGYDAPITRTDTIRTALGSYEVTLLGDIRSVNKALTAVATRVAWFVGGMLLAIFLTWLAIELSIIRRITELTRRAAAVSQGIHSTVGGQPAAAIELAALNDLRDLRGSDELGVLAGGLQDLLQRVNDDVRRAHIRLAHEKDTWHAVGHEIMSPLQSLMVLHGNPQDPAHRYISRMQQAVRVLYGSASPSEAFETSALDVQTLDIHAFLSHVANNAESAGIPQVTLDADSAAIDLTVRADEYALEDVISHVLRNAQRFRLANTPIVIALRVQGSQACITLTNQGPAIAPELLDKIFEYGVSDQPGAAALGQRGQGLFVAKTYMAKMGGTIAARNVAGGVCFELHLQLG